MDPATFAATGSPFPSALSVTCTHSALSHSCGIRGQCPPVPHFVDHALASVSYQGVKCAPSALVDPCTPFACVQTSLPELCDQRLLAHSRLTRSQPLAADARGLWLKTEQRRAVSTWYIRTLVGPQPALPGGCANCLTRNRDRARGRQRQRYGS